jgi:hypothetical protein
LGGKIILYGETEKNGLEMVYPDNDSSYILIVIICHIPVNFSINRAFVKRHYILRERASFVRENVLDLAELFVERGGARFGRQIFHIIIHFAVPIDPQALYGAYKFNAHIQRYGYDRV